MPHCFDYIDGSCVGCDDKKKNEKCNNIYDKYKKSCIKKFPKIDKISSKELLYRINSVNDCIKNRSLHRDQCISEKCRDDGHELYIKKEIIRRDNLLKKYNITKSNEEKEKKLEEKKKELEEKQKLEDKKKQEIELKKQEELRIKEEEKLEKEREIKLKELEDYKKKEKEKIISEKQKEYEKQEKEKENIKQDKNKKKLEQKKIEEKALQKKIKPYFGLDILLFQNKIKQYIGANTCELVTNKGNNCDRSLIYENKDKKLNCISYCMSQCDIWLDKILPMSFPTIANINKNGKIKSYKLGNIVYLFIYGNQKSNKISYNKNEYFIDGKLDKTINNTNIKSKICKFIKSNKVIEINIIVQIEKYKHSRFNNFINFDNRKILSSKWKIDPDYGDFLLSIKNI